MDTFPSLPGVKHEEDRLSKLTRKHELILQCYVVAMDEIEIGKQFGVNRLTVRRIINSELGQARIGQLRQLAEIDTADIATQIHLGAIKAVNFLKEIVSNEGDGMGSSKGLRFKAAVEMLRMDGFTPVAKSFNVHANMGVLGEGGMQALLAKGRAVKGMEELPFEKKEPIEADFEQLIPEGS